MEPQPPNPVPPAADTFDVPMVTPDMGSDWPFVVAALVVGLLMVTLYLRYERPRRCDDADRDRFVADAAARRGWQYDASAPQNVDGFAYPPFDRVVTGGHRVLRVVSGASSGLPFQAFDLEQNRPLGEYDDSYRYAVLAVPLRNRATAISIAPVTLQLDANQRESRLARREPFLEVPQENRRDIRTLSASRDLAEAVTASVIAVLDDTPGVGWGIDGDTMLLIRGGPAERRNPPRHWIEDLDEGISTLLRIDRALPTPLLGTA